MTGDLGGRDRHGAHSRAGELTGERGQQRLAAAFSAVRAAARATEAARTLPAAAGALAKDDRSPVTIADFASQAIVVRLLDHMLGGARLLGEESDELLRDPANAELLRQVVVAADAAEEGIEADEILDALASPRADPLTSACWTLDPVDGTKGFLRGGQYAIALSWLERGVPQESAVACPRLDLAGDDVTRPTSPGVIAVAAGGSGARIASLAGGAAHTVSAHDWRPGDPIRLALSVEAAHGDADGASDLARRVGDLADPLRMDSCGKYLVVAAGRADAYLRIPKATADGRVRHECVWDHAAGVRLALEAGCTVCDLRGEPLDFGRGLTLSANHGIIVAPPRLAERLVKAAS
jgi:HAL2 family 3'(2'),5'-bisphosphate nucleotidase